MNVGYSLITIIIKMNENKPTQMKTLQPKILPEIENKLFE